VRKAHKSCSVRVVEKNDTRIVRFLRNAQDEKFGHLGSQEKKSTDN